MGAWTLPLPHSKALTTQKYKYKTGCADQWNSVKKVIHNKKLLSGKLIQTEAIVGLLYTNILINTGLVIDLVSLKEQFKTILDTNCIMMLCLHGFVFSTYEMNTNTSWLQHKERGYYLIYWNKDIHHLTINSTYNSKTPLISHLWFIQHDWLPRTAQPVCGKECSRDRRRGATPNY